MTDVYTPPSCGFRNLPLRLGEPYTKTLNVAFPTTTGLTKEVKDYVRNYVARSKALIQRLEKERDEARKEVIDLKDLVERARVSTVGANDDLHMLLVDDEFLGADPESYLLGEKEKAVKPEGGDLQPPNGVYSPPASSSSEDPEGGDLEEVDGLDEVLGTGTSGDPDVTSGTDQ
ncbi:uncharacterized protein C8A04DRAFT_31523 [Dichotomopilus funicola]|uniref:Uncharacterized protein n=1 Tax=Dichotomopilus funicola TaxID=1934379 RepID=A0AAN6ZKR3_9PEZI|nr:hypothetical protein C8A04DRAFT_31523 [Dichotomopilus funicola]